MSLAWRLPRWSVVVTAAGLLCALLVVVPFGEAATQPRPTPRPKPEGKRGWILYVTLSPTWFDPGEFLGLTAFWVIYAIHDARRRSKRCVSRRIEAGGARAAGGERPRRVGA